MRSSRTSSRPWGRMRRRVVHPLRDGGGGRFRRGDQESQPGCHHQHRRGDHQRALLPATESRRDPARADSGAFPSASPKTSCASSLSVTWSATTRPGTTSSRSTGPRTGNSSRDSRQCYGSDRVTSDVIEAAYNSVHLWAQAVARGRVGRRRRGAQGHPPAESQCARRDRLGGRRDPAHLAARVRRSDPCRWSIRSGLELGKAGPADPLSMLAVACGMGRVPGRPLPDWGGWANPGPAGRADRVAPRQ